MRFWYVTVKLQRLDDGTRFADAWVATETYIEIGED